MGILLNVAVRNLLQAGRRTALLGFALALVTMLLVLLLALSQGITDRMVHAATTLSSGHVNVAGFYKAKPTDAAPIVTYAAEVRKVVEENTPNLDFAIDRVRGWARVISPTSSLNSGLNGIDVQEEARFLETVELAKESEYREGGGDETPGDLQKLKDPDQALLFAAQAKRLGLRVGDVLTITVETFQGSRNTGEYTVAAIAKDVGFMSNWSVFLSKEGVRRLYALDTDITGAIQIYLKDHHQSERVMGHLQKVLTDKGYDLMEHDPQPFWMKFEGVAGEEWTGQKLDLTIWSDEVSYLQWVLTAVNGVSFTLMGILMFIIAIGIMNSMWISVRERTTEIGTLRAIGMSRSKVLLMFLLEALVLGSLATTLGGVLGASIALIVNALGVEVPVDAIRTILMSDTIHMAVRIAQVLVAASVFTMITGIAALWPAVRASRMQPVTAIHQIQ